jgi:catechol 2,3-dioxygenase-like lactoylglutathione lyase family enzyme
MPRATLNHVSLVAHDIEASSAFYCDLFGMEPVPTPNFGFPVRWLAAGQLQLHLFQRPDGPPKYHHLALTVSENDFAGLYRRVRAAGITDSESFGHHLYLLPGDTVQLYLRDPSANLVEVDSPGASRLPGDIRADLRPLPQPQDEQNLRATLFLERT